MRKRNARITTKVGDLGETYLFSGEKVSKFSLRLEAYGDLDEVVSFLGLARYHAKSRFVQKELLNFQRTLFILGSELATTGLKLKKLPSRIDQEKVIQIEALTEKLHAIAPIPSTFIVPGEKLSSSFLDVARSIARRCERKIVYLIERGEVRNPLLIVWMNRLSDCLYLMARLEEKKPRLVKEPKK